MVPWYRRDVEPRAREERFNLRSIIADTARIMPAVCREIAFSFPCAKYRRKDQSIGVQRLEALDETPKQVGPAVRQN
jgi:hypothetical protein